MGKRSDFARHLRDCYVTPYPAITPLLPHLKEGTTFDDPCGGNAILAAHFQKHGIVCRRASDIMPQPPVDGTCIKKIFKKDAFDLKECRGDVFLTNPPWTRAILHPLISHLSDIAPVWLLFDADWVHTKQSAPYINRLRKIISVGRLKWIEGSKHTGKDNVAWHLFDQPSRRKTQFFGRT